VLLLALPTWLITALAHAGTARDRLEVSVTVVQPVTIRSKSTPFPLAITHVDIKRGYVEQRRATELLLENSGPVAFAIHVFPGAPLFSQVQIGPSGTKAAFGTTGGELIGWLSCRAPEPFALDLRFKLPPGH
jgi:hypothetical protein